MKIIQDVSIKVQVDESEKKLHRIQDAINQVSIAILNLNECLEKCKDITIHFSIIPNEKKWYQFWK